MGTYHITARIKSNSGNGMRLSGTTVAINAAGTFKAFSAPAAVVSATDSPLNAGHSIFAVDPPTDYINIVDRGAATGSAVDNIVPIRNAISAAALTSHKTVLVPAGAFGYNGNITSSAVQIVGVGPTSILTAIDWTNRAIWLKGDNAAVKNLALFTQGVGTRQAPWEYVGVVLNGATNYTIENCYIKHNGAAGIQTILSAGPGTIQRNTLSGTLADSIHLTDGAHHTTIKLNRIKNSGDDGVANVSYNSDGERCHDNVGSYNWISDNLNGRGMSVVGGQDIKYHNNLIQNNPDWAGIYIAQENSFNTFNCLSVSCAYNTIENCGSNVTGHAGIMIFSDGGSTNNNIGMYRNDIIQDGVKNGIRYFGPQNNVLLESNRISAASATYVGGVTAGVTIILYTTGNAGYQFTTPGTQSESQHNTTIPSATEIVDSNGASWTVSGGVIYRNGVATISSSVTLLLYYNQVVYQQNSFGGWWRWDNAVPFPAQNPWTATTDPRVSVPPMPSIQTARHPNDLLQAGVTATDCVFIEDNRWGAATITEGAGTGQFMQQVERSLSIGPLGETAAKFIWRWPVSIGGVLVDGNPSYPEVKGFPAIIYGRKPGLLGSATQWPAFSFAVRLPDGVNVTAPPAGTPANIAADWAVSGGSVSTTAPSGNPPGDDFPKQLPITSSSTIITGIFSMSATGRCHVAFDFWLQGSAPQTHGFTDSNITHEIMIPLRNVGQYGMHGIRNPAWHDHDVSIDGVLYHVYCARNLTTDPVTGNQSSGTVVGLQYNFGGLNPNYTNEETGSGRIGWKFIVFQHDGTAHPLQADGTFRLDIGKFMNHLNTRTDSRGVAFAQGTEHLVSGELGVEMVIGEGECTIWNYRVQV